MPTPTEIASTPDIEAIDENEAWKLPISSFTSQLCKKADYEGLPRKVRKYYKAQNELIEAYVMIRNENQATQKDRSNLDKQNRQAILFARISFFANVCLLAAKLAAAILSGSLSVITSVIDSVVDLLSGILIWCSNRAILENDRFNYPKGRSKLEPLAIIVLACIMACASLQMIVEAIKRIVIFASYDIRHAREVRQARESNTAKNVTSCPSDNVGARGPDFGLDAIIIVSCTIVIKLGLYLMCRKHKSAGIKALAQDHLNDVLSNSVAITCGLLGSYVWKYADPIGAILISLYIVISWFITAWSHIKMLSGYRAAAKLFKRILWIAVNHSEYIASIRVVRAFHSGNDILVEVDIVLPETLTIRESHNIGETLSRRIERLDEIERAFVHVDYDEVWADETYEVEMDRCRITEDSSVSPKTSVSTPSLMSTMPLGKISEASDSRKSSWSSHSESITTSKGKL